MPIRKELAAGGPGESTLRLFPPGSQLYRQGDVCPRYFLVLQGWVALSSLLADGSTQILDFATPGTLLGFQAASGTASYHSARCITQVEAQTYSRPFVDRRIMTDAQLSSLICRQLTVQETRAHDHIVNLGLRPARERIAHLLIELYLRMHGRLPIQRGETMPLPITQVDIAQAVGLTGVHVSRMLRGLREERVLRLCSHKLEILDPVAFARAAGIDLDQSDCRMSGLLNAA